MKPKKIIEMTRKCNFLVSNILRWIISWFTDVCGYSISSRRSHTHMLICILNAEGVHEEMTFALVKMNIIRATIARAKNKKKQRPSWAVWINLSSIGSNTHSTTKIARSLSLSLSLTHSLVHHQTPIQKHTRRLWQCAKNEEQNRSARERQKG